MTESKSEPLEAARVELDGSTGPSGYDYVLLDGQPVPGVLEVHVVEVPRLEQLTATIAVTFT